MAISALDLRRTPSRVGSRFRPTFSSSLLTRRRRRMGLLLTLPALVLIILLIVVPIGQAIYYSMTEWNGVTATWIGPSAWTQAFHNPTMWRGLGKQETVR